LVCKKKKRRKREDESPDGVGQRPLVREGAEKVVSKKAWNRLKEKMRRCDQVKQKGSRGDGTPTSKTVGGHGPRFVPYAALLLTEKGTSEDEKGAEKDVGTCERRSDSENSEARTDNL